MRILFMSASASNATGRARRYAFDDAYADALSTVRLRPQLLKSR